MTLNRVHSLVTRMIRIVEQYPQSGVTKTQKEISTPLDPNPNETNSDSTWEGALWDKPGSSVGEFDEPNCYMPKPNVSVAKLTKTYSI
jgi:hypothetical protein